MILKTQMQTVRTRQPTLVCLWPIRARSVVLVSVVTYSQTARKGGDDIGQWPIWRSLVGFAQTWSYWHRIPSLIAQRMLLTVHMCTVRPIAKYAIIDARTEVILSKYWLFTVRMW